MKRKERKHQYLKLAKSLRSLSHAKGGVKKLTYAHWTARTLKERTPLHVWEVDALRAGLVAEACKKFKNATSPLIRWMIRDELAAKVTELYRRPVF